PTQSIEATFLPARSAAAPMVSAWSTIDLPAESSAENDVEFANESPVRWKVLFVDPCSDGYVPVAIVYQPTPVFGGNACTIPLSPVAPCFISSLYVGMEPALAYFSIKSGRMPSDANITTLSAGRPSPFFAPAAPAPIMSTPNAAAPQSAVASQRRPRFIRLPPIPLEKRGRAEPTRPDSNRCAEVVAPP